MLLYPVVSFLRNFSGISFLYESLLTVVSKASLVQLVSQEFNLING